MALQVYQQSALVQFLNGLRTRSLNIIGRKRTESKVKRSSSGHAVRHDDFDTFITLFEGIMPDPDEVLKKAGLTATEYRKTLTDAHVGGAMIQRKSRNKLSTLVINPGEDDDGKITPDAERARDLVVNQFKGIRNRRGIRPIMNEILEAPFFGAAYLELFWNRVPTSRENPNGEIVLENILGKPFEWFAYDTEGNLHFKTRNSTFFELRPIPENKIIAVVRDGTYANPYGDRAAKRIYWPWFFKKGGFRFWAEFLEKYGMPFLHGRLDPNAGSEDLTKFHDELVAMVRNGVLVSEDEGKGTNKVDVIESKSRGSSSDVYSRYNNAMNIEISKGILGETLTIENSESGSQAATVTHKEILEDIQDEDKLMVEETFDKIFALMTRLNIGPNTPSPTAQLLNNRELNSDLAERDAILTDKIGVRFRKGYVAKTYKIADEDFELEEPADPDEEGTGTGNNGNGGQKSTANPNPEDTEGGTKGTQFAQGQTLPVQDSLDSFLDSRIPSIKGVSKELAVTLSQIIKDSNSFDELYLNIAQVQNKINNAEFSAVFSEVLNVWEVVGTWAAENNRN